MPEQICVTLFAIQTCTELEGSQAWLLRMQVACCSQQVALSAYMVKPF